MYTVQQLWMLRCRRSRGNLHECIMNHFDSADIRVNLMRLNVCACFYYENKTYIKLEKTHNINKFKKFSCE